MYANTVPPTPGVTIETVISVGTFSNQVLLMVNSDLLVSVTFDPEFSRMVVLSALSVELSTDSYSDSSLPQWVGPLANITFVPPLLFALTQDGLICILES